MKDKDKLDKEKMNLKLTITCLAISMLLSAIPLWLEVMKPEIRLISALFAALFITGLGVYVMYLAIKKV
jgi:hypothetical protein